MENIESVSFRRTVRALVALGLVALAGCASAPRPDAQLVRSDSAVKQAIELGARVHAPLILREAETKLNQARVAADKKENEKARLLAEQVEADAELAQVTTLAIKTQRTVDELNQSIDVLRKELGLKQ